MAEVMMIASMFESMAAWFTPTVLFCLTNLIIAIIFIASNNHHHVHSDSKSNTLTPIARVSSFLERSGSIKLSSYTTAESHHHYSSQSKTSKTANYSSSSRLAQSIYLPPESSEPVKHARSQPSLFERVTSFKFTSDPNTVSVESNSPGQLARVPSFLDRVKSFKTSSTFKSEPVSNQSENADPDPKHDPDCYVIRSKSEMIPVNKKLVEMKKSRSEVRIGGDEELDGGIRRPATVRERREEFDEEVDAKADDFISRFKQQLKLQRLESMVRYNEMLNRRS